MTSTKEKCCEICERWELALHECSCECHLTFGKQGDRIDHICCYSKEGHEKHLRCCICNTSQALSTEEDTQNNYAGSEKLYICPNGIHKNNPEPCLCDRRVPTEENAWPDEFYKLKGNLKTESWEATEPYISILGVLYDLSANQMSETEALIEIHGYVSSLLESEKKHAMLRQRHYDQTLINQAVAAYKEELMKKANQMTVDKASMNHFKMGYEFAKEDFLFLIRNSDTKI